MTDRPYDIVVFGATGFTGKLTAEYLAQNAPATTTWALAGRNMQKLEQVRDELGKDLPLLKADVTDERSVEAVAEQARVVITTVGPYINYGEPLVRACAEHGTDYVDLTGEPEFVDLMWLKYHDRAQQTGARIVHSCGFDSIPYDLGALYTVEQLPENIPIKLEGFVRVGGTFSGGTYHSALHIMGRLRQGAKAAQQRRQREPRPQSRKVRGVPGVPHRYPEAGGWCVPFPTIDPQTVLRSARALDRYGPDFTYSHYLVLKRLPTLIAGTGALGAVVALAQLKPTRDLLLKLKDPGEGPSPEQRARSWFKVRFVAHAADGKTVTQVAGGDPGYSETSKMLAESALCLAHDERPNELTGQLTPAVAMGDALIKRLQDKGISFEVLER